VSSVAGSQVLLRAARPESSSARHSWYWVSERLLWLLPPLTAVSKVQLMAWT
jgi:hypothetical protein